MNINDLVIGDEYSNSEIVEAFKCSYEIRGMRHSEETNTLVLIFDHNKIYDDSWEGDVLHYTGTGRFADQELIGANRTLYESDINGVNVHLLEVFEEGVYTYQGEVELAGDPYKDIQPDANGVDREVWMFPLTKKIITE